MMNDIARFPECLTGLDDPSRLTSIDARTDNTRPGNRTPAVRQVQSSFIWFHPDEKLAYFSYYSGGFCVASYNHDRLEEVGAFIDEGGNNFWASEIWHDENGEKFVVASDRDVGLYVFKYTGPTP